MIQSYAKDITPIRLLKEAVNIFADGEVFHEKMSKQTHAMGYQGLKRMHRYESEKDRGHRVMIEHYVIDMFGDILEADWNFVPPDIVDLEQYINTYINWELSVYESLNKIINALVIEGYGSEAKLIEKCLEGVRKEIERARRTKQDFELVNYDISYIKLMDKKRHDKIKRLEKED